jgi:OPT oligopeptide transporter protein
MMEISDAIFFTVALALHWSRQGRQCYPSSHYAVCRFCSKSPCANTVYRPLISHAGSFKTLLWMLTSTVASGILVALVSQIWLRRYHPGWYRKYNYILGGALDGGAQVMIFILSFAVFGASGIRRPFPSVKF